MEKHQLSSHELYGFLTYYDDAIGQDLQNEVERFGWELLAYEDIPDGYDNSFGCYVIDAVQSLVIGHVKHASLIEAVAGAILEAEIWLFTEDERWRRQNA